MNMVTSTLYDFVSGIGAFMMIFVLITITVWFGYAYFLDRWGSFHPHITEHSVDLLRWLAWAATIFQLYHLYEHWEQVKAWWANPHAAPWMSWLFQFSDHGFAAITGHSGDMAVGMELTHFVGNWIFFLGVCAWYQRTDNRWIRWAFQLQAFHMVEHVCLTATMLIWHHPVGVSTLLGFAPYLMPDWIAASYRVWWHFSMNLAATALVLAGIATSVYRRRAESLEMAA